MKHSSKSNILNNKITGYGPIISRTSFSINIENENPLRLDCHNIKIHASSNISSQKSLLRTNCCSNYRPHNSISVTSFHPKISLSRTNFNSCISIECSNVISWKTNHYSANTYWLNERNKNFIRRNEKPKIRGEQTFKKIYKVISQND